MPKNTAAVYVAFVCTQTAVVLWATLGETEKAGRLEAFYDYCRPSNGSQHASVDIQHRGAP